MSGLVWRWCCPCVVSAACSVWPAASLLTELYEPSPLGHDHVAPLLAFSLIPSSTDEHMTQTHVHRAASPGSRFKLLKKQRCVSSAICSRFTFFSSAWCFWNWMICCRLSGGALLSLLGERPGTPTMPGVGSSSTPSSCPRCPFSSIFAQTDAAKKKKKKGGDDKVLLLHLS